MSIGVTMPPHLRGLSPSVGPAVSPRAASSPSADSKEEQKRKRTGKYEPHPDDMKILNRITDEKEFIKIAKRLRARRKKMNRDCDFGGTRLIRAKTLVDKSQGRAGSRTNFTTNNVRTMQDKILKAPGPAIPSKEVLEELQAEKEAANAPEEEPAAAKAEGDGSDSDSEDEETRKVRKAKMAELKEKEKRHNLTGGREYARFADKRDNPDRLTWDEFTTLHHGKMDHGQQQDMAKYRRKLDEERSSKLAARTSANKKRKKSHKKHKKHKKKGKKNKRKKRSRRSSSGADSGEDSGPMPLSAFMRGDLDDD